MIEEIRTEKEIETKYTDEDVEKKLKQIGLTNLIGYKYKNKYRIISFTEVLYLPTNRIFHFWSYLDEFNKELQALDKEVRPHSKYYKPHHGLKNDRLYPIWNSMKQRCSNSNNKDYKHYGGRGIKVYSEWLNDFKVFYDWAKANGYKEGLTIDRIDNNGNYEPSNCRWVTQAEQKRNRRNVINVTYKDKTKCLREWADILKINYSTLKKRYKRLQEQGLPVKYLFEKQESRL